MRLQKKVFIHGKIELLTGLHIGGSSTALDIGGIDSNVIKDANGVPYIPGSSIKGKIRSLLEMKYSEYTQFTGLEDNGKVDIGRIKKKCEIFDKSQNKNVFSGVLFFKQYGEYLKSKNITITESSSEDELLNTLCDELKNDTNPQIQKLFGSVAKETDFKTRLIVRDAYLNNEVFEQMKNKTGNFEKLELDYTEGKWENTIDRLTSAANPRQLERVPAGAKFDFSFVFTFYEADDENLFKLFLEGMQLLEDDYLGGSGSRGYGQIIFRNISIQEKTAENYQNLQEANEITKVEKLDDLDLQTLSK